MKAVGSLYSPWLQEVARDEEVALIFLRVLWSQIVGEGLARSTEPLLLRDQVLEVGVPTMVWEGELQEVSKDVIARINSLWSLSLVQRLVFRVVHS